MNETLRGDQIVSIGTTRSQWDGSPLMVICTSPPLLRISASVILPLLRYFEFDLVKKKRYTYLENPRPLGLEGAVLEEINRKEKRR